MHRATAHYTNRRRGPSTVAPRDDPSATEAVSDSAQDSVEAPAAAIRLAAAGPSIEAQIAASQRVDSAGLAAKAQAE